MYDSRKDPRLDGWGAKKKKDFNVEINFLSMEWCIVCVFYPKSTSITSHVFNFVFSCGSVKDERGMFFINGFIWCVVADFATRISTSGVAMASHHSVDLSPMVFRCAVSCYTTL